jgi:hypothetical protein
MGTSAFVALLMTLCNKSFSATQFALLSALCRWSGLRWPLAGWFVEAAWLVNVLSVFYRLPCQVLMLLLCKETLEFTQRTERFMPRTEYAKAYRLALRLLATGCLLLGIWLFILIVNASGWSISLLAVRFWNSAQSWRLSAFLAGYWIFCRYAKRVLSESASIAGARAGLIEKIDPLNHVTI